ncbi:MAG: DNA-binding protein HU-beta [Candidatus Marinamargulisbacteria bacterium]|jgi:DNA-binding protein HU-beta
MNKKEIIDELSERVDLPKNSLKVIVEEAFDIIMEALVKDQSVNIVGFGAFEVRQRAARRGRNPKTGTEILIPETRTPAFRPSKNLTNAVKGR